VKHEIFVFVYVSAAVSTACCVTHKEWIESLLLPFLLQFFPFSAGQNCSRYSYLHCFSHWILNNVGCLHGGIVWTDCV